MATKESRFAMLTTCPNCGNPVCSDCGSHVAPGAIGALPMFKNSTQVVPVKKPGLAKPAIVTWNSSMP